jgi:nucleotide-binding universal stress UspA family protein
MSEVPEVATTAAPSGSTIVVPLDGSALGEAALPIARTLLAPDGELALTRVVYNPDAYTTWSLGGAVPLDELDRAFRQDAEQELSQEADRLGGGARVRILVGAGDPAEEIARLAGEVGAELIVLATHGRGAFGRWTHGSVADRVARIATIPVVLVRPDEVGADEATPVDPAARATIGRLLLPLDGSEMAERAVPIAERYARRLGVPLLLLRALNPSTAMPSPYGAGSLPSGWAFSEEIFQAEEDGAKEYLAGIAAPLASAGLSVEQTVEMGSAGSIIASAARPGDLIVMTSHGRGGIGRWLLGSTAEKLVREAPAPVLLVPAPERVRRET